MCFLCWPPGKRLGAFLSPGSRLEVIQSSSSALETECFAMAIPGQIELAKEPDFTGKSDPDPKLPLSSIQVERGGTGNKS